MIASAAAACRRAFTAAAAALGLAAGLAPGATSAEPAMWVVRDADSTIYLFGTVHVLRPSVKWRTPRLDKALASCRDLNLEVTDSDDAKAATALVLKYGMDLAHPLSTRLTPADRTRLAAAATTVGIPPERLELMKPWLAGVTLSLAPVLRAGYDPASGVEEALKADARARGEPIKGLETSESQIRLLASLPEADQITFVHEALEDFDKAPVELDQLAEAWAEGRVEEIDRLVNADLRQAGPGLYKLLLVDRNTGFARQANAMLAGSGTSCIAVGAAHLAGPDSVQEKLKALGVAATRY